MTSIFWLVKFFRNKSHVIWENSIANFNIFFSQLVQKVVAYKQEYNYNKEESIERRHTHCTSDIIICGENMTFCICHKFRICTLTNWSVGNVQACDRYKEVTLLSAYIWCTVCKNIYDTSSYFSVKMTKMYESNILCHSNKLCTFDTLFSIIIYSLL